MTVRIIGILAFGWFICGFTRAKAQKASLDLGLILSGNQYIGDYQPSWQQIERVGMGAGLQVRVGKGNRLSHNFLLGRSNLLAQKPDTLKLQNTNGLEIFDFFQTKINYLYYQLNWRWFKKATLSPFLNTGLGVLQYGTFDRNGGNLGANLFTRPESEQYRPFSYALPIGFGLDCQVGKNCTILLQYNYHYTGTDFLDNIGKIGNPETKDAYSSATMSVLFRLLGTKTSLPLIVQTPPPPQPANFPINPSSSSPIVTNVNETAWIYSRMLKVGSPILELRPILPSDSAYIAQQRHESIKQAIQKKQFSTHIIQTDETIEGIAKFYNIPLELLQNLNAKTPIKAGNIIKIPDVED